MKRIHVTKRDLFYTDVKLFEARTCTASLQVWCCGCETCSVCFPNFNSGCCSLKVGHKVLAITLLMQEQGNSDAVLDDVACMLGCTRSSLHGELGESNGTGVMVCTSDCSLHKGRGAHARGQ